MKKDLGKRALGRFIVWHRLLALPSCIFFGIWFVSGVVMMYARMPELTEGDRLAHLPALDLGSASALPPSVSATGPVERITVGMLHGRPVYRVLPHGSRWFSLYADTGAAVGSLDAGGAIESAAIFSGRQAASLSSVKEIDDVDQWTVYPASRPYLPFRLISGNDVQQTVYYVSASTGAVYLTTTLRGRVLAWCGAIPHWWYITALRSNNSLWHWVLIAASGWGVLMSIFGIAAGAMRYSPGKKYRFPGPNSSGLQSGPHSGPQSGPRYSSVPHVGMKRWHYILGYGFGLITFTWILSGLFSMNPGNWSPGPEASLDEMHAFAGAPLDPAAFRTTPRQAARILEGCLHLKEMEMLVFGGEPYYLGRESPSIVRLLPANAEHPACVTQVPEAELVAEARRAFGGAEVVSAEMLTSYDSYYYDRHFQKPLPMLRVRLADNKGTWLYINPRTALIQARYTERSRWERWLYNGLHSLDFPFLFYHRPLWDVVVIVLSIGGFALSITGIVLTVRYFQRSLKRRRTLRRA